MRMRALDICNCWSRVPGLNDYWCQQIHWRISNDDELIGALTEPRHPCPDGSLDTIILTQTIYLCQLFLHLQEFDPCAADTTDSKFPNDELLCVFQDSLAREFNFAYGPSADNCLAATGPAPVGEALERVVRGLMLAQRQEPVPPTIAVPPTPSTPVEANRAQLSALLIRILRELNEPVDRHPIRYEQAYGPRREETWAARFATRVMQWRFTVRGAAATLLDEVIEVQRHDVHPLDDEGLEVYRILRCTAPGLIHIVTPLHPERMSQQPVDQALQHQRAGSSGMQVQQMLGTPLQRTPSSSQHSEGSDTPRTTPQCPPQQPSGAKESNSSSSAKRGSEDLVDKMPPSKRSRPTATEGERGSSTGAAMARAALVVTDKLSFRGPQMDIDAAPRATVEETNALLRRTLEGIVELGRKMDGMQAAMDARLQGLDDKLNRIFEWVGSED